MHTSSQGDAIDEWRETVIKKGDQYFYKFGTEERPMMTETIKVPYKTASGMAEKTFTIYRTHHGAEIDLLLELPSAKLAAIEVKFSNAPTISKGFYESCNDLKPAHKFIITPESDVFFNENGVKVCSLAHFLTNELPLLN